MRPASTVPFSLVIRVLVLGEEGLMLALAGFGFCKVSMIKGQRISMCTKCDDGLWDLNQ